MFGVSFTELLLIAAAALIVVGPDKLPKMLGTLGRWSAKLRRISTEVRQQSGIDDILRKEGIAGGLGELRQLRDVARGNWAGLAAGSALGGASSRKPAAATAGSTDDTTSAKPLAAATEDPFANVPYDRSREYPVEGCDAYGCLPDDLWASATAPVVTASPEPVVATPSSSASPEPAVAAPSSEKDGVRWPADSPAAPGSMDSETSGGSEPRGADVANAPPKDLSP